MRATSVGVPSMISNRHRRTLDQRGKFANSSRDRRARPSRRRGFSRDRSREGASHAGLRAVGSRRAENYTQHSIARAGDVKKTFEFREFSPKARGSFRTEVERLKDRRVLFSTDSRILRRALRDRLERRGRSDREASRRAVSATGTEPNPTCVCLAAIAAFTAVAAASWGIWAEATAVSMAVEKQGE